MKTDGNNSAFALHERSDDNTEGCTHLGLTKREYFAAMAMQGYISSTSNHENITSPDEIAKYCLAVADALITELNKDSK